MIHSRLTLQEFADLFGTNPRNVRYLLSESVLPPPLNPGGRMLFFDQTHVEAYRTYEALLEEGLTARLIGTLLELSPAAFENLTATLVRIRATRNKETA